MKNKNVKKRIKKDKSNKKWTEDELIKIINSSFKLGIIFVFLFYFFIEI